MSRPRFSRSSHSSANYVRVNGRIRAREVRVVGEKGEQLGILTLANAISLARSKNLDLVEVAATARPPVCRLVDYGKFRYEQSKKNRESRKHQHANKVKEVQLRPSIDPHDFDFKRNHAIEFLCDENKLKITLRFRGRENAHKEFGFKIVNKMIDELAPYGTPDAPPKLVGRGLNVMISPLPRNKRAPNPHAQKEEAPTDDKAEPSQKKAKPKEGGDDASDSANASDKQGFQNNPFSSLNAPSA